MIVKRFIARRVDYGSIPSSEQENLIVELSMLFWTASVQTSVGSRLFDILHIRLTDCPVMLLCQFRWCRHPRMIFYCSCTVSFQNSCHWGRCSPHRVCFLAHPLWQEMCRVHNRSTISAWSLEESRLPVPTSPLMQSALI